MANPVPEPSLSVLLVEDDPSLIKIITEVMEPANCKVKVVGNAKMAFAELFKSPPDVVIVDINLPDLDGFHVAKELKRNMMLRYIPVIILSSRIDFLDKMRGLDVIVDEYLVKPIDSKDLLLRTQLVVRRSQTHLDANPLTRLPGNTAIVKEIKKHIGSGSPYAIGYADLNNFKAFNDKYGFSNGDKVILETSQIIIRAVQALSPKDHFVGHVGGDDFIFVCGYEKANEVCQTITETFDKTAPNFYSEEDRKKGFIVVEDRRGIVSQFPLVSVAIGMVSDEGDKFSNLGQVNHSLTQLKKYAKSFQGSAYVRDRRVLAAQMAEFTWGPGSAAGSSKVLESITTALGAYMPGQINEIIKNQSISILFQPILDMKQDEVIGHESLVRGPSGTPLEYPDALFQTARTANLVVDLDILCLKKVLKDAQQFHKDMKLFVNIYPETLLDENRLNHDILNDPAMARVDMIIELAGSQRASDANDLFATLFRLKNKGIKICIDATVALMGHGSRFLPDLRPNYIKLNMRHYNGMSADAQKFDEFVRMVQEIRRIGSEVICTKLEDRADSVLALKSGVTLGQGFLFARPAAYQEIEQ